MAWNIAGSFVYAFASILLSFLVMRISGDEIGGIFAFGYSTFGQQMFTVAYYGIRPFQITDGRGEYSFGDYLGHRILTCALAVLTAFFYLLWTIGTGAYTVQKGLAVFLLALYKVIDGFADVYESEFQRRGRLYLTGKSNTFRTVLSVCAFTGALLAARGRLNGEDGLLAACLAAAAAQLLGVALFNFSVITRLPGVVWKRERGQIKRLFGQTSLLFVSVFLDFYIFSAAKYAIDANLTDADSGYFNLIFMPTSVIYLVANFVIRPFLTVFHIPYRCNANGSGCFSVNDDLNGFFLCLIAIGHQKNKLHRILIVRILRFQIFGRYFRVDLDVQSVDVRYTSRTQLIQI